MFKNVILFFFLVILPNVGVSDSALGNGYIEELHNSDTNGDGVRDGDLSFKKGSLCIEGKDECHDIPGKTYMYSARWNGGYYVILYDGSSNVSSSSGQEAYNDGFEVYSLKDSKLTYISNFFYESSIDSFFRSIVAHNSLVICASKECSFFRSDGSTSRFSTLEVGQNLLVTGLQLSETLDGFRVFLKESALQEKAGELETLEYKAFSVILDKFFIIQSTNELSTKNLLTHIFNEVRAIKQPFFLRQDNKEGRITWGQHYVIDWYLLSQKHGRLSESRRRLLESNFQFYFEQDLIKLLMSRRYSVWRQDGLFLLHISRLSQLVESYTGMKNNSFNPQLVNQINDIIKTSLDFGSNETVEVLRPHFFDVLNETRDYLKFSDNGIFWADGANVPVNYVSDYVIALIGQDDQAQMDLAESMLSTHIDLIGFPIEPSWLYWYGDGLNGWTDGSVTTPVYDGDKYGYAAHISYRSADAAAFLKYCQVLPRYTKNFDCSLVREQLHELILLGNLEPYLLNFFDDKEDELSPNVISKFSQLSYLSDLRNLIFLQLHY